MINNKIYFASVIFGLMSIISQNAASQTNQMPLNVQVNVAYVMNGRYGENYESPDYLIALAGNKIAVGGPNLDKGSYPSVILGGRGGAGCKTYRAKFTGGVSTNKICVEVSNLGSGRYAFVIQEETLSPFQKTRYGNFTIAVTGKGNCMVQFSSVGVSELGSHSIIPASSFKTEPSCFAY